MEFVVSSIKFKPIHPEWENFRQSESGVIGKDLLRRARRLQQLARISAPRKTGLLAASITIRYSRGLFNPSVNIGARVPYAYWVHEGTRPHKIRAHRDKLMRFVIKGRVVYIRDSVNHPGTRPTKYLSKHLHSVTR